MEFLIHISIKIFKIFRTFPKFSLYTIENFKTSLDENIALYFKENIKIISDNEKFNISIPETLEMIDKDFIKNLEKYKK